MQKYLACYAKDSYPKETASSKGDVHKSDLKRKDSVSSHEFGQFSSDHPREQSHFGSPVVIEALAQDLTSMDIPDILQNQFEIKSEKRVSGYAEQSDDDEMFDDKEVRIVIGQSINPAENSNAYPTSATVTKTPPMRKKSESTNQHTAVTSKNKAPNVRRSPNVQTGTLCLPDVPDDIQDISDCVTNSVKGTEQQSKLSALIDCKHYVQSSGNQRKLHFYTNGDNVILIMERGSKFYFCGKLIIKVLYGVVNVDGAMLTLQGEPVKVYHPKDYCYIPVVTGDEHRQGGTDLIISLLLAEGIEPTVDSQTKEMQLPCTTASAVLKLQNFDDYRTKFVSSLYGLQIYPKVESSVYYHWTDPRKAEIALQCNLYFHGTDSVLSSQIVEQIAYEWCTIGRSCTLLAGGKGVGKSSVSRYLTNRLLPLKNKVVVVDLDIGQTEFTPPGCVSYTLVDKPLLGPNFTHSVKPLYQLYIGEVNVVKCISQYIQAVKMLMKKLSRCPMLSNIPIVVNTMGFTTGIGWPLMILVIKLVRPTNVLQIKSEHAKQNFPKVLSSQNINEEDTTQFRFMKSIINQPYYCTHNVYVLQSQTEHLWQFKCDAYKMQPYQKRDLMTVCYFSDVLKEKIESASQIGSKLAPAINEAVPHVASLNSLCIAFSSPLVPPSQVLTAINGNIVALCSIDLNDHAVRLYDNPETMPTVLRRAPVSTCYGFGIVRGIDTEKSEIYIITPVPSNLMEYVNCLQGCHQVPAILLQSNLPDVPYTSGVNSLPTSRETRRGYFRMRYERKRTSQ